MTMTNTIRKTKAKGITGLAWTSVVIALLGGTAGAGTFIGTAVRFVLDLLPWAWLPAALLIAMVVASVLDCFMDGVPNHPTVISAILAPSVASAAGGKFGEKVTEWTGDLMNWVDDELIEYLGTDSSAGIAITCVAVALILARRVIKKAAAGRGGPGGF